MEIAAALLQAMDLITEILDASYNDVNDAFAVLQHSMCEPSVRPTSDFVVPLPDVRLEH